MRRRDPHVIKSMAPAALVEEFRPLVGSIVNKIRHQLSVRVSIEDLESYGYEGLLEAQSRFDPDDGSYFASYAYYRIRGSILDGCRREGWVGRARLRSAKRMRAMDEMLESSAESERDAPAPESLSDAINRVTQVVDAAATIYLLSDSDLDGLGSVEPSQLDGLEQQTEQVLLRRALDTLTEEEREVVQRFHFDEEPMAEIAVVFGKSRSWVSRVNARALGKLRDHILSRE